MSKESVSPSAADENEDKNDDGESEMSPSKQPGDRVTFDEKGDEDDRNNNSIANNDQQSLLGNSVGDVSASVASSWAPPQQQHRLHANNNNALMSDADSSTLPSTTYNRRRTPHKKKKNRNNKRNEGGESLTERLGNSALASTFEILKLAGGVTLSTTGTILSPSLELTKNVIVPNLLGGIADYLSQVSPQRLKDWFRIFSASIHHLVAVIVATERGSIFRHKIVRVGGNVVDVVCSDTSRQVLMDGMAAFIKLSEAMHTPEFKAFLEQMSILGCRAVDAAANGQNKQVIHNVVDLAWSGVELVNDPATTVAFAEVAAYLCYALEMEDAAIHAIAKERSEINRTAAEKRRERDQYQSATYQEPYLLQDPNATVEEVILSAFGVIRKSVEEARLRKAAEGGGGDDIPGSVVLGSDDDEEEEETSRAVTPPPVPTSPDKATVNNNDDDDEVAFEKPEGMGDHDVDVRLLREKITKHSEGQRLEQLKSRAAAVNTNANHERRATIQTSNRQASALTDEFDFDDGKKDIEDLSSLVQNDSLKPLNSKPSLIFENGNNKENGDPTANDNSDGQPVEASNTKLHLPHSRPERSMPLEGETPAAHFYRVMDQVLTEQREIAMKSVIPKKDLDESEEEEALDAGRMKRRLSDVRSERRTSKAPTFIHPKVEEFINENETLVCASVFGVVFLGLIFCLFGLYGMYVFVFPPTPASPVPGPVQGYFGGGGSEMHVPLVIQDDPRSSSKRGGKDEYVIRVIREVVHVNSKGEVLKQYQKHSSGDEL